MKILNVCYSCSKVSILIKGLCRKCKPSILVRKIHTIHILLILLSVSCSPKKTKDTYAEMTSPGMYVACNKEECAICREDDLPPWEALDKCIKAIQ